MLISNGRDYMPSTRPSLPHLRLWRTWKGYSQRELALQAHVARATIAHLETAQSQANYATVAKLAEALGVTREQLLHEIPQMPLPVYPLAR
jgi:transcriptional regulator with XRE-family HTH domain